MVIPLPGRKRFAKDFKEARLAAGLSQEQATRELGLRSVGTVSSWERALRMPDDENRVRVATFLGISEEEFLARYAVTGRQNPPAALDGQAGRVREQAAAGRRLAEEILEDLRDDDRELLERLARRLGGTP